MPNYAFVFGEATIQIATAGGSLQSTTQYATSLSIDEDPVALEDGSIAYKRVRWAMESPWVDDDILSIRQSPGPWDIVVTWLNADDLRLRSEAIQNAIRTGTGLRGSLEGGAQVFSIQFEALTR